MTAALLDHLWQSTLCAGLAAVLAIALRTEPARLRHAVWMAASLKFLFPFWILTSAGMAVRELSPSTAPVMLATAAGWSHELLTMGGASIPVTSRTLISGAVVWAVVAAMLAGSRLRQWWHARGLVHTSPRIERGREADALARALERTGCQARIDLRFCSANLEPAAFGIRHPVLLWPSALSGRLTDDEIEAILLHEVRHVERRDNGTALLHMVVETLFWFHPLVWIIGSRLTAERERACDEEVVRMGINRHRYASGIVKVCRFCLRVPAGVMGAGSSRFARRVGRILEAPMPLHATPAARVLLAGVLAAVVALPVGAGALREASAQPSAAQEPARPGNGVTTPVVVHEVHPKYTAAAMQAGIQGSIVLQAVVLETGAVGEVKVVKSLDKEHGLDDEAVKAMKEWRFKPGTRDGKPVPVSVDVEMTFTLKS
jgi:TonB family protein